MTDRKAFHLHLVSDATGETIHSIARACLVQFEGVEPIEHFWNLVRSDRQLEMVLEEIESNRGLVLYTLINDRLRQRLLEVCHSLNVPTVSALDPVLMGLGHFLGLERHARPGFQHALDDAYFSRVEAIEYALSQDDGQGHVNLDKADVVLVGVSRTTKTPTSLYLANRGVKAANVPFVPNCPLPPELETVDRPLIVGLTQDPDRLIEIRRNRLKMLGERDDIARYFDREIVRDEVREARRYYMRNGWPVIDVTRRAIEETAAEILTLLARRRHQLSTAS